MITTLNDYINYLFINECFKINNNVNEGLIKTYNPDITYSILQRVFRIYDHEIFIDSYDSQIKYAFNDNNLNFPMEINIDQYITLNEILGIEKKINLCGYIISTIIINDILYKTTYEFIEKNKNNIFNNISFLIDAKYDVSINMNKLKDIYIYHITHIKYKDKILTNGLIPKSKNKLSYHLDRIYFETNITQLNNLATQLYPGETNLIYLKINIKDITCKFYQDPNYSSGIYTFENIPPNQIEILNT